MKSKDVCIAEIKELRKETRKTFAGIETSIYYRQWLQCKKILRELDKLEKQIKKN